MSSTDEDRLRRFFIEHLVPTAEIARARGVQFLSMGPEQEAGTWYSGAPGGGDFFTLDDVDACAERLTVLWRSQGLPELAELVPRLMSLSEEIDTAQGEAVDVSPFIYVMY